MTRTTISTFNTTFLPAAEANVYCTAVNLSDFIANKIAFHVTLTNGPVIPAQTDLNVYFGFASGDLTLDYNPNDIPAILDASKQTFAINPADNANSSVVFYSNVYRILANFVYIWFSHAAFNTTVNATTNVFGIDDSFATEVIDVNTGKIQSDILPDILETIFVPVRGTESEIDDYIGTEGELATDENSVRLMDGVQAGGKKVPARPATLSEMQAGSETDPRLFSPALIGNSVQSLQSPIPTIAEASGVFAGFRMGDIPNNWQLGNSITNVVFGNRATSIGSDAFRYNQLSSLTIPATLSVGDYAFADNPLTTVNCYITRTALESSLNVFANTGNPLTIHVRASDVTWTAGTGQSIAGNPNVTVIKDL